MKTKPYKITFTSEIIIYPGMSGWRFLVLPKKEAGDIKEKFGKQARGWGSHPVSVTVGKTTWETSIFPDKKSGTYILPLKSKIRKAEGIFDEDIVSVTIQLC